MPNNSITEAQALVVAMRSIVGLQDEKKVVWYEDYFLQANIRGIGVGTHNLYELETELASRDMV